MLLVRIAIPALVAAWIFPLSLAAAPDISRLPPPDARTGLTYAADIRPIFEVNCFRCHGSDRQKASLRLDSLAAVLKGSEDGRVVLPADSAKSPLVLAVARLDEDTAMPPIHRHSGGGSAPGGPAPTGKFPAPRPLTPGQVGLIRAWIDQGAK
ncbi:MAG: hypothetical protein PHC88_10860 [Terrimicrobiaceae bacterium]|nr:hypothetical protein [Terrimicrobiaceae bacterium]